MHHEITDLSARVLAAGIRSREFSAVDALEAHLAQIDLVNPTINAIVTLDRDAALATARAADDRTLRDPGGLPPLHGVPMTHKDTHNTAGLRTTQGSPIFRDFVPDFDDVIIERMKAAGVITTGKSNVPEFAAGSHTFNEVFGTTVNPWDPSLSAGGSSGGVAAAIAARIQPIGDGSDMGGSLRVPASFCNVVGFRPSPGVVPSLPSRDVWSWLGQAGTMAREVGDIALVMSAIAGDHPQSPFRSPVAAQAFAAPLEGDLTGVRVAFSRDFGLGIPVDAAVLRVFDAQLAVFESLGAHVEEAAPDLGEADLVFANVRAMEFALRLGGIVEQHGDLVKEEIRWNVEKGWAMTSRDQVETTLARSRLEGSVQRFFGRFDVLATPTAQVLPFDAAQRYPTTVAGVELDTYLGWMRSACVISATGLPALAVPAGFSGTGLPVGLQLVANRGRDVELLRVGHAYEQATRHFERTPPLLR
ncbi:MAG: amidase [Burkholderiaceae bacterium]|nr:amidase [Microbacteriaceae bacterium]